MRLVIFIATIAIGCASAQAQTLEQLNRESLLPMLGTISVEVTPNFTDSRVDGCSIGFRTLAQDWIYKQGAFIAVSGGFGVMTIKGTYAAYLKVTVHDVDPRTMQFTPSPPAGAYFVAGNTTTKNAIVGSIPSDEPGTIFVVSHVGPTFPVFSKGLADGKVTIAFARKKDGSDVVVAIDTNVVDTAPNGQRKYSDQISTDFLKCAQTLLEQSK
jgi:hypothetical protein